MGAGAIFQTFAVLLIAHLVADFVLQPERIAINKGKIPVLSVHIAIVAITAFLALGYWAPWILIPIAVTHFFIDLTKSRLGTFNLAWFLADQASHIVVLVAVSVLAPADLSQSLIYSRMSPQTLSAALIAFVAASGFIAAVLAGTYAIELFLKPFRDPSVEISKDRQKRARMVGQLERLPVFVFMLFGSPVAAVLVLVAKAILLLERGGEDRGKARSLAVTGSLASFAWAAAFGALTVLAIGFFRAA